MDRTFFVFVDTDDQAVFINTSQIRQVVVGKDECEICFSETHRIRLTGIGMAAFLERMRERSVALNGEPIDKLIGGPKSESSS